MEKIVTEYATSRANYEILQLIGQNILAGIPGYAKTQLMEHLEESHSSDLFSSDKTAEEVIAELEDSNRKEIADNLEAADRHLEFIKDTTRSMTEDCSGPLTIKSRSRDRKISATVCSAALEINPFPDAARVEHEDLNGIKSFISKLKS